MPKLVGFTSGHGAKTSTKILNPAFSNSLSSHIGKPVWGRKAQLARGFVFFISISLPETKVAKFNFYKNMISELFAIIFLASILGLIISIVKPSVFEVYMKPVPAKKNLILSFLVLLIFSSYMMVKFSPTEKKEQTPDQHNNQAVSQPVDETKKGEDVKTSAPAASSKTDTTEASSPQPTAPKSTPQQSEPPKEKSYQQIFSFSGNGAKSSEPFTITGSRFKIKYDCSGTFCQAFLYKNGTMDDLIMNASGPIKDETIIYGLGEYYINANTSGSFVMTVEDYK